MSRVVARASGDAVEVDGDEGRFLVYSVTKTFLGTLALLLAEDGRLRLDDSVREWVALDDVPDVPLRRLLDHTAGIPDYGLLPEYASAVCDSPGRAWGDRELLGLALTQPRPFAPGEGWAYSNTGYLLVRLALEAVAGEVGAALEERVLEPLGLRDTRLARTPDDLRDLVAAPSPQLRVDDVRGVYDPCWVGHRTLASTAADVARFFAHLTGGRVLAPASYAEFVRRVEVPFDVPWMGRAAYGVGVMIDAERLALGHGGGGPGYRAGVFGSAGRAVAVLEVGERDGVEVEALELLGV